MFDIQFNSNDYDPENLPELFGMRKQFIAYLDIVGFEEKVNKGNASVDLKLLYSINDIINHSKEIIPIIKNTDKEIKMKVFSDNFLFCTENDYFALLGLVSLLQSSFIECDLFIRGSLYYGELTYNDDFVYGKGLLEAYKIENEISIFPRVIIDDTFFSGAHEEINKLSPRELSYEEFLESLNDYYCTDFDTNKYINYLGIMENYFIDGQMKYNFRELLQNHAANIRIGLKSESKRVLQKYQWCRNYHNEICKKYQYNDLQIEYPLQNGIIDMENECQQLP